MGSVQDAWQTRNANYATILRSLTFTRKPWFDVNAAPEEAERYLPVHRAPVPSQEDSSSDSGDEAGLTQGTEPTLLIQVVPISTHMGWICFRDLSGACF